MGRSAGGTGQPGTDLAGVGEGQTLRAAGHLMRELGVTSLPVCGADGSRRGIVSSEMIVRSIAAGGDPTVVTVGELTPTMAPADSSAGFWQDWLRQAGLVISQAA